MLSQHPAGTHSSFLARYTTRLHHIQKRELKFFVLWSNASHAWNNIHVAHLAPASGQSASRAWIETVVADYSYEITGMEDGAFVATISY